MTEETKVTLSVGLGAAVSVAANAYVAFALDRPDIGGGLAGGAIGCVVVTVYWLVAERSGR